MWRTVLLIVAMLGWTGSALAQSPATLVKVVGDRNKLALFSDGRVVGWGANDAGQVGPGGFGKSVRAPQAIPLPGRAIDISSGGVVSYALLDDGRVATWGRRFGTEAGSDTPAQAYPQILPWFSRVVQVQACGALLVLRDDGSVYAWGSRGSGTVGDGKHPRRWGEGAPPALTLVRVPNVSDITQISCGGSHAIALRRDGQLLTWGSNYYGALGWPPRDEQPLDHAQVVPNLTGVVQVVGGSGITTVVKADGTVWVWGANYQAQFGNGQQTDPPGLDSGWELVPQKVPGLANVASVSNGIMGRHTLALLKDGTLRGWGNTDWGQLGAGVSGMFQARPVTPKLTGVKAVFAAGNNSFAVTRDGSVWAWGYGDKTDWPFTANTKIPVKIDLK